MDTAIPAGDNGRDRIMARIASLGICLLLALGLAGRPAVAEGQQRIAAVVNDDVISIHDVNARLSLIIGSSNFPDTPEVRGKLLPQIIRMLIDEKLKMQQAKEFKITVTESDINSALSYVEKQNGLPPGGFEKFLAARGLDRSTAVEQLRADVAWVRVVQGTLLPTIRIGDDEVEAALAQMKANLGRPERLVSELFLPVDNPSREEEVLHLAQRLSEQI
ncbi:MAG: SurA N-terminal domain-containing protein, partial [Alphaproteobacteria bacterium]|nr:SurA N-terminal domain-containing protein [Alphaproteobacteria bacterium]